MPLSAPHSTTQSQTAGPWKRSRDDVTNTLCSSDSNDTAVAAARRRRSRAGDATGEMAERRECGSSRFQTPVRRDSIDLSNPLDAPTRCRSPSTATSDADGLTSSENSVHFLEIGFGSHSSYPSSSCGNEEVSGFSTVWHPNMAPPPLVLEDTDAQQWQRELIQFFAHLDQRPLCVVPVPQQENMRKD